MYGDLDFMEPCMFSYHAEIMQLDACCYASLIQLNMKQPSLFSICQQTSLVPLCPAPISQSQIIGHNGKATLVDMHLTVYMRKHVATINRRYT